MLYIAARLSKAGLLGARRREPNTIITIDTRRRGQERIDFFGWQERWSVSPTHAQYKSRSGHKNKEHSYFFTTDDNESAGESQDQKVKKQKCCWFFIKNQKRGKQMAKTLRILMGLQAQLN